MTSIGFLLVYILGGLTFIPLVLSVLLLRIYLTSKPAQYPRNEDKDENEPLLEQSGRIHSELEGLPDELKTRNHVPDVAAGYFAVCREYVPGGINGKPPERTTPAGTVIAMESPSVYQSMYRSIFDRNKTLTPTMEGANGKSKRARNVFYVVLRLGHLMLYDDSDQLEVRHVISLTHYDVDVYAGGEPIPEGELWIKRNCIRLSHRLRSGSFPSDSKPFYFFSENCSEKEDFYYAMLQSQDRHPDSTDRPAEPLMFNTPDLVKLIQQLHASEENLHTRWINALTGRLFLALYKTPEIEAYIRTKITKKIARVPKPALISSINLERIDMGNLPPFITNPKLREFTIDGDLTVEADVSYKGNFRIEISAVARIDLGARFKAREVTLVLATILKSLEGHVLVRIKPPPSNRMWFTFETAPKMEFSLEPIVSTRQITYGVILRAIESRLREVVSETLVLPNWDDTPFSDTLNHAIRGGIWSAATKGDSKEDFLADKFRECQPSRGKVSDSDDSDPQTSTLPLKSAVNSMPNLGDATLDSDPVSNPASSKTLSRKPSVKPKAMQSGSFTEVAGPMVNNTTSMAKGEVAGSPKDAASAMMALSKSPPPSPLDTPVGSPAQPTSTRRSTSPASFRPGEDDVDPTTAEISATIANSIAASSDISHPPERSDTTTKPVSLKPRHSSSLSLPRNTFGSVDKRQTLNKSIGTATAAAKKWFASRQGADLSTTLPSGEDASPSKTSSLSSSIESNHGQTEDATPVALPLPHLSERNGALGSSTNPIGRGQPLPPPGTPLPLPVGQKRSTGWAVPTVSAFANLTKRKPVPSKQPEPKPADKSADKETPPMLPPRPRTKSDLALRSSDSLDSLAEQKTVPGIRRKSSATQPVKSPSPGRRQRLSVSGKLTESNTSDEGLFIVEAPVGETSTPASPSVDVHGKGVGEFEEDESSRTEGLSHQDEGVFQGMEMDEGVT